MPNLLMRWKFIFESKNLKGQLFETFANIISVSFLAVPRQLNRWPIMRIHDLTKKKTMTKTKTKTKTKTMTKTNTFRELHQRAILETCDKDKEREKLLTCDIWDTDYNYDNWEPDFMTIFVTWQLRVTLDSIRNSCDVLGYFWWLPRSGSQII